MIARLPMRSCCASGDNYSWVPWGNWEPRVGTAHRLEGLRWRRELGHGGNLRGGATMVRHVPDLWFGILGVHFKHSNLRVHRQPTGCWSLIVWCSMLENGLGTRHSKLFLNMSSCRYHRILSIIRYLSIYTWTQKGSSALSHSHRSL